MTINPRDYDPGELKDLARERDLSVTTWATDSTDTRGSSATCPDEALRSGQYRELLLLEGMARERDLRKPYLDTLPETYAAEMVTFEWLEFLLAKAGFKQTLDALRYYESIGWLSEDVAGRLQEYLQCLDEPAAEETSAFDRSDHVLSLIYAARLSLMDQ